MKNGAFSGDVALDDCLFCKIAAHQIPAKVAFESDDLIAFHDIHPAAPVHLLIVPKLHIASLADCRPEHASLIGDMHMLATRLAGEFGCMPTKNETGALEGGYRTVFNCGPDGGQEIYHLHLHVLGGKRPWNKSM